MFLVTVQSNCWESDLYLTGTEQMAFYYRD